MQASEKVHLDDISFPRPSEMVPFHPHDFLGGWRKISITPAALLWMEAPPGHLITPASWVNTAFPDWKLLMAFQTLSQVL